MSDRIADYDNGGEHVDMPPEPHPPLQVAFATCLLRTHDVEVGEWRYQDETFTLPNGAAVTGNRWQQLRRADRRFEWYCDRCGIETFHVSRGSYLKGYLETIQRKIRERGQ